MEGLFDIVVPDPVAFWPPGPAWFVLAGLIVLGIALFAWRQVVRWRQNAYRRSALHMLDQIARDRRGAGQVVDVARDVNQLLKRVALASYDRRQVAGLSESDWIDFLRSTGGRFADEDGALLAAGYKDVEPTSQPAGQVDSLISAARGWIRHHHV